MVNKFGDYTFGGRGAASFLENIVVVKKVIVRSGKYKEYNNEIQTSITLGFPPYRIASSTTLLVYVYNNQVWCLGSVGKVTELISEETITETNYLAYWVQGDMNDGDGVIAIKGDQGRRGEKGDQGDRGLPGNKGEQGDQGRNGDKGNKGKRGASGSEGPPGKVGRTGPIGLTGPGGSQGIQGLKGDTGSHGDRGATGSNGAKGIQGIRGLKGDQGGYGEKGKQGIQGHEGPQGPVGRTGEKGDQGAPATTKNIIKGISKWVEIPFSENFRYNYIIMWFRVEMESDTDQRNYHHIE